MAIDWFTVAAQLLNFLILVWLLKRYLYKPVLDAIDAREQRIATELAAAQTQQAQAQEQRDSLQRKNAEFDQQRDAQMAIARSEAQAERQRLLEAAQQTADELRTQRLGTLESELQQLREGIALRSRAEVLAIVSHVLGDLAGASLEQRMVEVFLQRLQALGAADKAALARALQPGSDTVLLRSAFELAPQQRQSIRQALQDCVAPDLPLRFETTPVLVSGIELSINGWKLAWNIADFLDTLALRTEALAKDPDLLATPVVAEVQPP